MGEGNSKRIRPSAWSLPSSSKLEADIAYFEARLSMLDEKPATCYQSAQRRAYSSLENSLVETLDRLRAQQRKRRKIKATSEVPLADQLDQTDIQTLLAEEALKSLKQEEAAGEGEKAATQGPASPDATSPNSQPSAEAGSSKPPESEETPLAGEPDGAAEGESPDDGLPEGLLLFPNERDEEQGGAGQFDSDNLYLRTALFSEHLSFLQEPEEVEDQWEDVEESEIEENLGQLDVPAGEDGVAEGPLDDEESIQLSEAQSDLSAPPSSQSEAESASDSRGPDAADQEEGDEEDYSDSFFDSWLREK